MPPRGKLTDLPDISAYVLAHVAGIAWALAVNPTIFRSLVALGYRDHLLLAGIANSLLISAVVLLIFLLLRKAMAGSSSGPPPPPAAPPAPRPAFTDFPELSAYVLAHAAGIAFGATVTPMIFRSLIEKGARNLMPLGIAISLVVSIVVLLIFLFLRKAMAPVTPPGSS